MPKYIIALAIISLIDTQDARAQLFGHPRTVGRPLTSQNQQQADIGTVTGVERFLRGNRGRAAFVGADRSEGQGFVGSEQARTSGTIVSSTAGVAAAPDRSASINRPLAATPPSQMTLPKLVLSRELVATVSSTTSPSSVATQAQNAVSLALPDGDLGVGGRPDCHLARARSIGRGAKTRRDNGVL